MRRWPLAVSGLALLVAGCSGTSGHTSSPGSPLPEPGAAASPSSTAAPPTPAGSVPASGASSSGAPCPAGQPQGTYRLTEFAGQASSALGHGKGGDLTVTFADGVYRMQAKGQQPMSMEISNEAAGKLYVDGVIDGTYETSGSVRTFRVTTAKGTAYVSNDDNRADVDFSQLTKIIGLDGKLAVACRGDRLALAGDSAVFYLVRA